MPLNRGRAYGRSNRVSQRKSGSSRRAISWCCTRARSGPTTPTERASTIFRLGDGKIAEHWGVLQRAPMKAANRTRCFRPPCEGNSSVISIGPLMEPRWS